MPITVNELSSTSRVKADASLAVLAGKIKAAQNVFYANHGYYWQGLDSSEAPDEGVDIQPDGKKMPTNMTVNWEGFGIRFLGKIPFAVRVDVMERHGKDGYSITAKVKKGDGWLEKTEGVGIAADQTKDWTYVIPNPDGPSS